MSSTGKTTKPLSETFGGGVEPVDRDASFTLRLIDKYPSTLKGRAAGILVND